MSELGSRAKQILYHCVSEYVRTAEPVGSRTLARKCGLDLSSASIRNVLSDLEEAGFLQKPHTSAGRIPTERAFRLFIDALMQVRELSREEDEKIRDRFLAIPRGENVMKETGKLLAELTGTAAVVVAPSAEVQTLRQLRFMRLGSDEILAVLVLNNGAVQNRFIRGVRISDAELSEVHELLDDVTDGRTLGDVRELFQRRLSTDRVKEDVLRRRAFELGSLATGGALVDKEVVIEGQERLFEKPEFAGTEGLRAVVNVLDAKEKLVRLLDATLEAKGRGVVVGSEAGAIGGGQLSIVGAAYTNHGQAVGSVAVIGPTRMDYPKVLPIVAATANAMSEYMDRTGAAHEEEDEEDG